MKVFFKRLFMGSKDSLPVGTTIFESASAGTYSVEIPVKGKYHVVAVGAGGGSALQCAFSGTAYVQVVAGGSGGCIQGDFELDAGTYTAVIGALGASSYGNVQVVSGSAGSNTSFGDVVTATAGNGGYIKFQAPPTMIGGAGGSSSYDANRLVSGTLTQLTGKTGATDRVYSTSSGRTETRSVPQTASVYGGYGAGSGGSATAGRGPSYSHYFIYGTDGYLQISYAGK